MSTAGPPFISVRNLHKQIGDQQILRGINLTIREGENLVIIGGSGTGKSVFLKLVMGLIPATSGSIIVDNTEITTLNERQLGPHRRKIGMLFQDGALFDSLTVAENVAFPLRESGMKDSPDMHSRIHEVLAAVGLADHGHKLPAALSGGMRKRAALARAVVSRPRCIFYDEPTAGLDPIVSDSIDRLIRRTQLHYRCTSVVVTHDMRSVRSVADRVVYFRDGLIHFEGSPDQLFSSTDPLVRQFVEGHCDEDE
ncbi:MAG: phospholipid/cholesterol/gamma-HCH transport system ATP-binding protein [Verrucomicrobia bacterium]|jgi:phospholipid/cholesterol/gamma-HCH transport system ATP-binding protein|nr:MAG: phospholipid/cholesterol/gamma-HCH transport system ATP-binding protein [Verrucomicrobiota bacterium]